MTTQEYIKAVEKIRKAKRVIAFTGAGISAESGIPTFRGENGLWKKYDPIFLELNYFYKHPEKAWELNKEIFYKLLSKAKPNLAHRILAQMEKEGFLHTIITQNIDNLHQEAGSKDVIEFHGTYRTLTCIKCQKKHLFDSDIIKQIPPSCSDCQGILKPDYIFFGEPIPDNAHKKAINEAQKTDVMLIIGTTGEVQPASIIPFVAKEHGATIIEINTATSKYTGQITDIFLEGKATEQLYLLKNHLEKINK